MNIVVECDLVTLDSPQGLQFTFWRECTVCLLEALAHDAVNDQLHEANRGMRANGDDPIRLRFKVRDLARRYDPLDSYEIAALN